MGCIKELFNYSNLQSIYKNNEKFKESYILNKVKTSLIEKLCKIWLDDMQVVKRKNPLYQNRLRTYRKFKKYIKATAIYLINCNKQQRQIMTKFRVSAYNLKGKLRKKNIFLYVFPDV